jgi:hypothetical protein
MKHLKKFNEALSDKYFIMDLEKFCNDNLSYLTDIGFEITLKPSNNPRYKIPCIHIRISKKSKNFAPEGRFKWCDVMYDFIAFFELLDEKYILKNLHEGLKNRDGSIPKPVFLKIYCEDGDSMVDRTFTKEEVLNNMIEKSGRLSSKTHKESKIIFLNLEILDKK